MWVILTPGLIFAAFFEPCIQELRSKTDAKISLENQTLTILGGFGGLYEAFEGQVFMILTVFRGSGGVLIPKVDKFAEYPMFL